MLLRKIEINYQFEQSPEPADVNMLDAYAKYRILKSILYDEITSGNLKIELTGKNDTGHWSMKCAKPE
ncbi:MAG: hypothetical protein L3J56_00955 [Bacteroidales bacterium]|nr:hypothetical protein [Bacteroidales bacterium]